MYAMSGETRCCRGGHASGRARDDVLRRRLERCRRLGGRPVTHYGVSRYYDPQTGQFMSVDPMVQQTLEAYEYAADDPTNRVDPDGEDYGPYFLKNPLEAYVVGVALVYGGETLDAVGIALPVIDLITSVVGPAAAYIGDRYIGCSDQGILYDATHGRQLTAGDCGIVIATWWFIPVGVEVEWFPPLGSKSK